ncbi:MAG: DUF1697 domain-containing protein [Chloroflexota bacterium]
MRAVVLLRGINVGTGTRVPMAELREVAEGIGLTDVATYVQSGNLAFTVATLDEARLASSLEAAILTGFGVRSPVMIRTGAELATVASSHPFAADEERPALLHVVFLRAAPAKEDLARLDPARSPADRFTLDGREFYLHYPNGSGRSKLTLDYIERRLGTVATARNWKTVQRLATMTEKPGR